MSRGNDRRASRSRWIACAAACAGVFLAVAAGAEPHLSEITGRVEIGRGEPPVWRAARAGEAIGAGDAIRTGADGRVEVVLGTGTVRVHHDSLLRIPVDATRPEGPASVALDGGDGVFEVAPRRGGDPFEVRTPEVVASVKGTRFTVSVRDGARAAVTVYAGLVGVRGPDLAAGREVLVHPGFSASARAGEFELSIAPDIDPWQSWEKGLPLPAPAAPIAPSADAQAVDDARAAAHAAAAPLISARVERGGDGERRTAKQPPAAIADAAVADVRGASTGGDTASGLARTPGDAASARDDRDEARDDMRTEIRDAAASALINGTAPSQVATAVTPPAGGAAATPLSVQLVTNGGSNRVIISSDQGVVAQIGQGQLQQVLDTGDATQLPPPVLNALNANGVDPIAFAQQLQALLH